MLAFRGVESKAQTIARMREHAAADRLVKGQYWEGGKGCAVGCMVQAKKQARGLPDPLGHPRGDCPS